MTDIPLKTFAEREIRTREDYLYFKAMLRNYPDTFPQGTGTPLTPTQMSEFKEGMKDRKTMKEITKEIRKVTKKDDKYTGNGKVIEDPKAKAKKDMKTTKVKKK
jgi:hypothetical protein